MTDIVDDAQVVEAQFLDASLAKARLTVIQPSRCAGKTWSLRIANGQCVGCGDPIDPERRAALPGAFRCLECQEACERRERGL